jgi:hypothetical protein
MVTDLVVISPTAFSEEDQLHGQACGSDKIAQSLGRDRGLNMLVVLS